MRMSPRSTARRRPPTLIAGAVLAVVVALVLAACGGSSNSGTGTKTTAASGGGSTASSKVNAAAAAMVPAQYKKNGITVGMFTGAPPEAYVNSSNQLVGFDPSMIRAVGQVLGVPIHLQQMSFENALLGLTAGHTQIVPGSSVTPQRLKQYDFVGYVDAGYTTAEPANSAKIGSSLSDLCGKKVATLSSVSFLPLLNAASKQCPSGKSIQVLTFPDWGSAELAVQSGRANAVAAPAATLALLVKQQAGKWQLTGPVFGKEIGGYALKKDSALVKPLAAAINVLVKNGEYAKILHTYGVPSIAVNQAKIYTGS